MFRSAPDRTGHQNGLQDEDEEEEEEADLEDAEDASHLETFMRDRRRARSLPAYPADPDQKRVKFADSMGLSLARVRHFSSQEEPRVPSKVLSRHRSLPPQDQDQDPLAQLCSSFRSSLGSVRLLACFPELQDAERRVRDLRVCLESVAVTRFDVRGQVLVLRGGSVPEVGVRFTFNDWLSYVDARAAPAEDPAPAAHAPAVRFGFTVFCPPCLDPSTAVQFAVFLRGPDGEFWDNNQGRNYTLRYQNQPGAPRS